MDACGDLRFKFWVHNYLHRFRFGSFWGPPRAQQANTAASARFRFTQPAIIRSSTQANSRHENSASLTEKIELTRRLEFLPLTTNLLPSCSRFNQRLSSGGFAGQFNCTANDPTESTQSTTSQSPAPMAVHRFVAVDASGETRGAYQLRWQKLWLRGAEFQAASYGYPVSEGIIDKQYAMLGVAILRDAVKRCEFLYTLGSGGANGNVFRVARHSGWQMHDVPFFFRVIKGGHFVRYLPHIQRHSAARPFAKAAAATGLAPFSIALLQGASALARAGSSTLRLFPTFQVDEVPSLAAVAGEIWSRVRGHYEFCVVRDAAHVDPAFPPARTDLHRLVIRRHGAPIGWAVVMTESLSRLRAYLGDVTPGLIVDAFGDPTYAREIVRAATAWLVDHNIDVVLTNTSHIKWTAAYRASGFLPFKSQYPLIVSRALVERLQNFPAIMPHSHFSRGDGDGVHYLA